MTINRQPDPAGIRVVILGAGQGTRLMPLSLERPKPFCSVGSLSLLEVTATQLVRAGFKEATLVLAEAANIPSVVARRIERTGLALATVRQRGSRSGQVPAVASAVDRTDEAVLVIYGDSLLRVDLAALVARHRHAERSNGLATLLIHRPRDIRDADSDGRTYHGIVAIDAAGMITSFVEKPLAVDVPADAAANAAVFICSADLIREVNRRSALDFSRDVFESAPSSSLHSCWIGDGYRLDIGNLDRLFQANMDCLQGHISIDAIPSECAPGLRCVRVPAGIQEWHGPVIIGEDVEVSNTARVGPRVVLGNGSRIGSGAVVRDSVLLDECVIGADAVVEGSIVGPMARVASGTTLPTGSVLGPLSGIGTECFGRRSRASTGVPQE